MKVLIAEKLTEDRFKDTDGYLIIKNNAIARLGSQMYKHYQVFENSNDMQTDVEVWRVAEEVFAPEAMASFENKAVTVNHPESKVTVYNDKNLRVGFARDIHRGTKDGQEVLLATIVITDGETIQDIEDGINNYLSCGYNTDVVEIAGRLTQTNIRGNHVALCENPRAGNITSLADSLDNVKRDSHFIKVLLDALDSKKFKVFASRIVDGIEDKSWFVADFDDKGKAHIYCDRKNAGVKSMKGIVTKYYVREV